MDKYFRAAVCDLDKLLDEFELNTDECDLSRTPQNPYDSKHASLPLDLDFLQHVYPTPKLQEDANSCAASEEISRASHTRPNERILNCSSQNERSVAGPDLLSIVNSGSSEGSRQGSNLNSNVCDPKDETACEKLPCELQDGRACSAVRKEMCGGNAVENVALEDQCKIESMPSDLPNRHQLDKSHAALPGSHVLPGSVCQTYGGAEVDLEEKITEENVGNEEVAGSEILNSALPLCVPVEDVQTSLSHLPLPESPCVSSVVTEEVNPLPQNEIAEVISDGLTVHAPESKTDLSNYESCRETDLNEHEGYLTKISQNLEEKKDEEICDTENAIDDGDSEQIKAIASTFLDYEAEPYDIDIDSYYSEGISQAVDDFAIEEGIIESNTLISDAELDEFLYGQSHDSNFMEADAEVNLTNANLDFTKVTEEHKQTELEDITSMNSNLEVSLTASKLEPPTEESVFPVQDVTENGSEALFSKLPTEGARPKQLLGCPQETVDQRQLNQTHVLEKAVTPEAPFSKDTIASDKKSEPAGKSGTEAGRNGMSESVESLKTPAVLLQKQPLWVPDSEAPNCMNCQVKFTFTKRRHHCRACGKVFCGGCCKRKCKLQYMEKEARVCTHCYDDINKAQAFERMMSPTDPAPSSRVSSENSSAPPLQEAKISGSDSCPSSSASLPISALKQPDVEELCPKEQRRVWFADGILPTGELAHTTKLASGAKKSSQNPIAPDLPELRMAANPEEDGIPTDVNFKPREESDIVTRMDGLCPSVPSEDAQQAVSGQCEMVHSYKTVTPETKEYSTSTEAEKTSSSSADWPKSDMPVSPASYRALCGVEKYVGREISLLPDGDKLPPLLLAACEKGEDRVVEGSHQQVTSLLEKGDPNPLTFILNANLLVNVNLVSYSSEKCWYFSTNGLHGLGQAEIIILLQCLPDEKTFPKDIFRLFIDIYKDAVKGKLIGNMENITFTENFLNNEDHGGFLFVSPTYQKLDDLILPDNPFLCGILIHKMEVPWAKVFPIRLMLRLGAEYGVYPTPVVSFRHRKPLFGEIGHTIMNLLVDLRNYQYTLHTIDNLFVHAEMGRSCVKIPLRKYDQVMKVINSSNDHVISIGASFNTEADSHFVCVQNKQGHYHTQANSTNEHPRKVTGASFVVFNGALKTSSGFLAKSSIVEDGLMVQITPETMESLRQALRDKKDFKIICGQVDAEGVKEYVDICWVEDEEKANKGILSPVDGKSMEGTLREKIPHTTNFKKKFEKEVLKCTEVYYFLKDYDPVHFQFATEIATACITALCPHLKTLKKNGMNKIGLRVSVDSDTVEYLAGSGGHLFPQKYLNELDKTLIPVIHEGMLDPTNLPLKMELIFFLTEDLQ